MSTINIAEAVKGSTYWVNVYVHTKVPEPFMGKLHTTFEECARAKDEELRAEPETQLLFCAETSPLKGV